MGKSSFLLKHREDGRGYVTLDDPASRLTARLEPELFLDQHPFPLVIDECQLAPELFPSLKKRVDEWRLSNRDPTSPVWLSGSNQILLDDKIRESLAGRVSYYHLHPLSLSEVKGGRPDAEVRDVMLQGGWPLLWSEKSLSAPLYYADYIRTALEKDALTIGAIEKTERFTAVLRLLAGRVGNLLSAAEVAKDAGVSSPTASDWIDLLTRLGFIYKLRPYHTNLSKRVIKAPKVYYADVGLASRLSGWSDVQPLLVSPQAGPLFENLVFSELIRLRDSHRHTWEIFFWRTKEGEEVDFVVENGRHERVGIEVKLGGGDPLRYVRPKQFEKVFGTEVPVWIVGLSSETREWGRGIRTVHPFDLGRMLLDVLG